MDKKTERKSTGAVKIKKIINGCLIVSAIAVYGCANIAENNSVNLKEASEQKPLCGTDMAGNKSVDQEYIDLIKNWKNPKELAVMSAVKWESESRHEIVYASEKLVSYKIFSWSYTGGAHGMSDTKVGTVRNGKVLKLADLPENIEKLWQKALNSHSEIKTIKEYAKFLKTEPQITENFYLDDKGIHFIYQPYEIAPFVNGTIDIFVPGKFE